MTRESRRFLCQIVRVLYKIQRFFFAQLTSCSVLGILVTLRS